MLRSACDPTNDAVRERVDRDLCECGQHGKERAPLAHPDQPIG
jgi:hypothetical protein